MTEERTFNNRYKIESRLGDGGMAVVYCGTDVLLRRRVAIKVLREQYAADEDFVRRFYFEAQAAAKLSHPNIVNTYDVGREGNTYYIVMELVDGATLGEMIASDGRIPEPVAIDFAAQICNALAYAHRQGLLHRDIKPANILVTKDDVVKLSDFGIARAVSQHTLTVTQPGMVMGSVYYLSPEQAQGHELHESSDLYSVGVVLFQMLSGKLPYTGESPVTVALKHVSDPVPIIARYVDGVSPALAAIVERLLQKNPADRFASASEVATALREARERPSVAVPVPVSRAGATIAMPAVGFAQPPPRPSQSPDRSFASDAESAEYEEPRQRRSATPTIVMAIALLIIAAVGGYLFFDRSALFAAKTIAVTDETGKAIATAQREIEGAGLHAKITAIASGDVPSGRVARQNPPAGTQMPPGSEIELFVSNGTPPREIDDVLGYTRADAQRSLERAGFRIKIVETFSDKPKAAVIKQDPAPGGKLRPGSTVTLTVSKGLEPAKVPSVVGLSAAAARAALSRAHLNVDVQRQAFDNIPPDQVASQSIADGTQVDAGSTMTIVVSTGPSLVAVPDVAGKTLAEASASLRSAGFVPQTTYNVQSGGDGAVFSQDPAANTQVKKNAAVRIVVNVPGVVPEVSGMTIDDAKSALQKAGYNPGNTTYVQEGEEGKVVRSEPAATTPLKPGESVVLYVNAAGTAPAPQKSP